MDRAFFLTGDELRRAVVSISLMSRSSPEFWLDLTPTEFLAWTTDYLDILNRQ